MEKQIRRFRVSFDFDWTGGVPLWRIKDDLDELEKLGVTEIVIEAEEIYGNPSISIEGFTMRLETDEEFKDRIKKENQRQESIRRKELADLEFLKKKYENKHQNN